MRTLPERISAFRKVIHAFRVKTNAHAEERIIESHFPWKVLVQGGSAYTDPTRHLLQIQSCNPFLTHDLSSSFKNGILHLFPIALTTFLRREEKLLLLFHGFTPPLRTSCYPKCIRNLY